MSCFLRCKTYSDQKIVCLSAPQLAKIEMKRVWKERLYIKIIEKYHYKQHVVFACIKEPLIY